MKRLLLLPAFALIASCATHLSQQQCRITNWQNEGYYDGAAGKMMRDLLKASQDCSQYGITIDHSKYLAGYRQGAREYCTPDTAVGYADGLVGKKLNSIYTRSPVCQQAGIKLNLAFYQAGRQKGLQLFCTQENGSNLAREGKSLPDVCPGESRAAFNAGYASGREQYCGQPKMGFSLGKANQPYPEMCSPSLYFSFKSEYDRGLAIGRRINEVSGRVNDLNERISRKVSRYSLVKIATGYYDLSRIDKSKDAYEALASVNSMVKEREPLDAELFNLRVMK